jgi:hypothetical protein
MNRVRLLSNNPHKSRALVDAGIEIAANVSCEATLNPYSLSYLRVKKERMGHTLTLGPHEDLERAQYPSRFAAVFRRGSGGPETLPVSEEPL